MFSPIGGDNISENIRGIISEIESEKVNQIIVPILSEIVKNSKELISGAIKRALKLCFCM